MGVPAVSCVKSAFNEFEYSVKYIATFLICLGQATFGATYYVATTGDNAGPGSQAQPWLTIQKAANTMVAGDTVFVNPGNYPERVTTKANGSFNAITYKATPNTVTNWGFQVNHSFQTIDGFNVTATTNIANYSGAIDVIRQLSGITIIHNDIHDFDAVNTKISGVHFGYASNAAMSTANVLISSNRFKNTAYIMCDLVCSNALVANNWFEFANSHDALHVFGRGVTIADNVFTNISDNPLVPDHTDIIQTFGDELVESYEVVFERNLIINCNAQLCQLEQKGRPNVRDWTFRNNLWVNVSLDGNVDLENCRWQNNIFYRCGTTGPGPIQLNCNVKGCANGAQLFNNIFFECGRLPNSTQQGWYSEFVDLAYGPMTYTADYNMVIGLNGAGKGANFTANGHETHGINGGDPMFVNPAMFDFHVQAGSVVIGAGTNLTSLFTTDYSRTTRVPPWDIGAYEAEDFFKTIPAGAFTMGDPYGENGADALPTHSVSVSTFYIGQFEVTNQQVRDAWQWAWDHGLIFTPNFRLIKSTEGTQPTLFDLQYDEYCLSTNNTRCYSGIRMTNGVFSLVPGREQQPCIDISWYGAAAYCNYRSAMDGFEPCFDLTTYLCDFTKTGYRLPTEAEWEKAARGGLSGHHYPWASLGGSYTAWISTNRANYTPPTLPHPFNMKNVGYFNGSQYGGGLGDWANGYGLYDMAGNAQEWCYDWYDATWYSQGGATAADTRGPTSGTTKVSRGGSFDLGELGVLACARQNWVPATANGASWYNGFRVARSSIMPPSTPMPARNLRAVRRTQL